MTSQEYRELMNKNVAAHPLSNFINQHDDMIKKLKADAKAELSLKKFNKRNRKYEESLQMQVATYLKVKHPDIIFRSDFAAGIKMTMGQAVKHRRMQHSRAFPDLTIFHGNHEYRGLFLELKKSYDQVYRKDGTIREDEHVKEQAEMLSKLQLRGYKAVFACGFDEAINIIENYLKMK